MTVGRTCTREVELAGPAETIAAAAERMQLRGVGTLLVVDEEHRPLGILSDRDLVTRVLAERRDPTSTLVSDVMTMHPRSVSENLPIEDALATMRGLGVRRMPVIDLDRRLVGLLSIDDVLSLLAEEFTSLRNIVGSSSPGCRPPATVEPSVETSSF